MKALGKQLVYSIVGRLVLPLLPFKRFLFAHFDEPGH
jgi:hypothetical protein